LLPGRHGEDGNITVQMADDERQGLLVCLREIHSELQKAMGELAQKEYAAAAGVLVSVENLMLDLIGDHGGNVLRHDDL
jgi:ribosomal protein L18